MLSEYIDLFIDEVTVSLEALYELFAALRARPTDQSLISEAFRIMHSLKSMAGTVECTGMVELCHSAEEILNTIRLQECGVPVSTINLLFNCLNYLNGTLEEIGSGKAKIPTPKPLIDDIKLELNTLQGNNQTELAKTFAALANVPRAVDLPSAGERQRVYRVVLTLAYDVARPTEHLRNILQTVGEYIGKIVTAQPTLAELTSELNDNGSSSQISKILERASSDRGRHLEFTIELEQGAYGLMLFLQDYCELESINIEEVGTEVNAKKKLISTSSKGSSIRLDVQSLSEIEALLGIISANQRELRELMTSLKLHDAKLAGRGLELTEKLGASNQKLGALLEKIRFVPCEGILRRFPKYLSSIADKHNKRINFTYTGEDILIDRRLQDQLYEILLQILRNAVDHGMEEAHIRAQQGKPVTGLIELAVEQTKYDWLRIDVRDDGRGLNLVQLRKKAIAAGLIDPSDNLSDDETAKLIFCKGLSTAEQITDISGRGIGMDIVAERLKTLHGHLEVTTAPGTGTTFTLFMPRSLF